MRLRIGPQLFTQLNSNKKIKVKFGKTDDSRYCMDIRRDRVIIQRGTRRTTFCQTCQLRHYSGSYGFAPPGDFWLK